jgi:hypothetical protein
MNGWLDDWMAGKNRWLARWMGVCIYGLMDEYVAG